MTDGDRKAVARILAKWDQLAYAQLCERAAALAEEAERLRGELGRAEDCARMWQDDWFRATEGQMVGLTIDGHAHVIQRGNRNERISFDAARGYRLGHRAGLLHRRVTGNSPKRLRERMRDARRRDGINA